MPRQDRTPRCFRTFAVAFAAVAATVDPSAAQVWEVANVTVGGDAPWPGTDYGTTVVSGYFDPDSYADFAVGAPGADLSGAQTGGVQIVYGNPDRTLAVNSLLGYPTIANARMGFALAVGNFDDTPTDEIAIGLPGGWDGVTASGEVVIWKAFPNSAQHIHQQSIPPPAGGSGVAGDEFGHALAAGDFNNDGYDDLAIGAPHRANGSVLNAGGVFILYGSASGLKLDTSAQRFFSAESLEDGAYGRALAAGDFDGDGFDDLAVGEPGQTISGQVSAGRVEVNPGSEDGIVLSDWQTLTNGSFGITHEANDEFGAVLAAGDFNRRNPVACITENCADDLAIGSPGEDVGTAVDAGIVIMTLGVEGTGLSTTFFQLLDQSDLGYNVEAGDRFGAALAAGQLDSVSFLDDLRRGDDLAIGSPGEVTGSGLAGQGVVHLLFAYGTEGLDPTTSQILEQRTGFTSAPAAANDHFGAAVTIANIDGYGQGDVVVGIPGHAGDFTVDCGIAQVLYGALFADGFERGASAGWDTDAP